MSEDEHIEELLGALDSLYKYASDDGCPHADCHRFSRPNKARLLVETWLEERPGALLTAGDLKTIRWALLVAFPDGGEIFRQVIVKLNGAETKDTHD